MAQIIHRDCDLPAVILPFASSASTKQSSDRPSDSQFRDLLSFCCLDMKDAKLEFLSILALERKTLMLHRVPITAICLVSSNSSRAMACDLCKTAFSLGKKSHAGAHLHLVMAKQASKSSSTLNPYDMVTNQGTCLYISRIPAEVMKKHFCECLSHHRTLHVPSESHQPPHLRAARSAWLLSAGKARATTSLPTFELHHKVYTMKGHG